MHWILLIVFHWVIILHYLDDFFAILLSRVDFILYQKHIDDLCIKIELKINHKKNICDTIVDFLNIELDNELMKTRLLKKKLERAIHEIKSTLKQLLRAYTRRRFARSQKWKSVNKIEMLSNHDCVIRKSLVTWQRLYLVFAFAHLL